METALDQIKSVCKKAFEECDFAEFNYSEFSEDITCFNETGTKCVVVFDNVQVDKIFIIVCIKITPDKECELDMFEARTNYDGVDAMHLANNYLAGNYSLATTHPHLKKKLENAEE